MFDLITTLVSVLAQAIRTLRQSPWFTLSVVTLLALGIGGNTVIFSMANEILFRPMPGLTAAGLVHFQWLQNGVARNTGHSYPNFLDYAAQAKTLTGVAATQPERFTLTTAGNREVWTVSGALISPNYFRVLGVNLSLGAPMPEDPRQLLTDAMPVVVSDTFWRVQLKGAADVVGQPVNVNGQPARIAGVATKGFRGAALDEVAHVWVPIEPYFRAAQKLKELESREARRFQLFGRLAGGRSTEEADAEFALISKNLQAAYPKENQDKSVRILPATPLGPLANEPRLFFQIMLAVAALALLVVCANVANLMLSRAFARRREIAIRQAIGAGNSAIYGMLLAEGLVLSLLALAAGGIATAWVADALPALIPRVGETRLPLNFMPDWRVALYGTLLALLSGLVFTLVPAIRLMRQDAQTVLAEGVGAVLGGRSRLGMVLTVVQLALCAVLLSASGLLTRSLYLLDVMDPRFRTENLLLVSFDSGQTANPPWERLRERIEQIPGAESASLGRVAPMTGSGVALGPVQSPGRAGDPVFSQVNFVSAGYLRTLEIPLTQGREFAALDTAQSPKRAIVNETLARLLWPDHSAVGQLLLFGDKPGEKYEVIGVARNAIYGDLSNQGKTEADLGFIYLPYVQHPDETADMTFHIAYRGQLDAIVPAIRSAALEVAPRMPPYYLRTMNQQREDTLGGQWMMARLMGIFGAGSVLLAAFGLYSVIAYQSARRIREFGLRVALGATPRQLAGMVLGQGVQITAIGLAVGFALSAALGKVLESLLYGVTPTDPATFGLVFSVLIVVSLVAVLIPAWRSARVDPLTALRLD